MTYVYSPVPCEADEYEEKGLTCIKQRLLFTGGELATPRATPFSSRSALLSSTKQPVLVYLRVRPKNSVELATKESTCLSIVSDNVLLTIPPKSSHTFRSKGERTRKNFIFSQIFPPDTTQKTVFKDAVLPTIGDFLNGQNSLVFSYGVTNSGKSYTVTGKSAEPGILPRALDVIFNSIGDHQFHGWDLMPQHYSDAHYLSEKEKITEIENKKALLNKAAQLQQPQTLVQPQADTTEIAEEGYSNVQDTTQLDDTSSKNISASTTTSNISRMTEEGGSLCLDDLLTHEDTVLNVDMLEESQFSIWVSFAEIYNEFIYDLLGDEPKPGRQRNALKICEDRSHNPFIKGLREVKVELVDEALQLLRVGMQHRHVAATRLNYHSSRSHAIFTIKILRVNHTSRRPKVARINRLSIVDLAGSESTRRTGATGMRVKEAGNINNSLLTLGRCIEAMRHNQLSRRADERVVPFRESKLTQLLQTYFVGKGKGAREGKVTMFVNVSDTASVFDETVRVLNFSALASKVVPETRLPPSLFSIPESSPFRPDSQEKDGNLQPDPKPTISCAETSGETTEICEVSCSKCKMIEKEFECFKERARDELAQAKLETWEKEFLIRQQVSSEYNEQLVEIEDKHNRELRDQEQMLEEMHQERLGLLQKSMKKQQTRKRVRAAADNEEEGDVHEEALHQAKETMRENTRLKRQLAEARQEIELEQKRAAAELHDMSTSHETNMIKLREITNSLSLEVNSLKKELTKAQEDRASLQSQLESVTAEQTIAILEREQAMRQAESFRQERNTSEQEKDDRLKAAEKENEELLMQIIELESTIRSPSAPPDEASCQTDPAITGWSVSVVQELLVGDSVERVSAEAAQVELDTLRGLVNSLKNEISTHCHDEKLMKSQHSQELERLKKELKTSEALLVCEHETTLDYMKQQLEERTREVNQYREKAQQLTSDLKNATNNASVSDGLVMDLQGTLQQYEKTFQSHSSHVATLTSENELLKESNEALQEKAEADDIEIAALKLRVERMADNKNALSARIEELTDELAKSSRHLLQRETELTDVHESAREVLENQIADLKKRCAVLEQEVKEVHSKLEDKEEAIVGLHKSSSSEQVMAAVKVTSLNEELQQVREALREIEEERDQLRETMANNKQQLDSIQGNHQLELAQMSIKLKTLSEQLASDQQSAEARLYQVEQSRDQCEDKLRKENQQLQKMLAKKTAEMTSSQKQKTQQVAELKEESQQLTQLLEEERRKVTDLEQQLAKLQSSNTSPDTESEHVYEEPPETDPLYDSVQDDNPLPVHESTVTSCTDQLSMNITRQLPLLEHSSQLRDSFEDFEVPSPRKVIKYDPLKDARRPKKKKVMATVNKGNETPPPPRYALRSRTKPQLYTELTTDSDTENTTPIQKFKRYFKAAGKKTGTTEKKKKITKSKISSPIVLGQVTPEVSGKKRQAPKMSLGISLLPPSKTY